MELGNCELVPVFVPLAWIACILQVLLALKDLQGQAYEALMCPERCMPWDEEAWRTLIMGKQIIFLGLDAG